MIQTTNLLHLEQFYQTAKLGNVTRAARFLRLSQPALSKSIRLLEESLGYRLFERTKKGVVLTPSGEIAFAHASRIFSEALALRGALAEQGSQLTGEWGLGASDNLALHLLPPILSEMKRDHPLLRIQLFAGTSGEIKNEIFSDRCETGLFFTKPKSTEGLEFEVAFTTEFWIVIARESPWVRKRGIPTLEDLKKNRIPRIESRHKDYAGTFPAHFHSRQLGLPAGPYLETNLHAAKKEFVRLGMGYALLVKHSVEEEVKNRDFLRIPTSQRLLAPVYWVTRKGRAPSKAAQDFYQRLKTGVKS